MIVIYWLYERNGEFMVALKTNQTINYYTDVESLKKALSSVKCLATYGDSRQLALILSGGRSKFLNQYLLMDLSQELGDKTIEEIGFFNGFDLKATTIKEFCEKRIAICDFLLTERESYFETKLEIIQEFGLKPSLINRTRASIAAEVLGAIKQPKRANILMYEFSPLIPKGELPERLISFYEQVTHDYKCTFEEKLRNSKLKITLAGLTHTFGFGGVHAAREKYKGKGLYLHIDVKSFFTSIMVNHGFISEAIKEKARVKELHNKKVLDGKETYKIVINAIVGSMNNPYSKLYDPKQFFSITVNGQLMMAHLILILENFIEELIQTNTDGIVVKIHPEFEELVRDLANRWADHYKMNVAVTKINEVIQRNVNNYIMVTEFGDVWQTGIYAPPSATSGSLKIAPEALVAYQLEGVKPQDYLVQEFKKNQLEKFQYVASKSRDSEKLVQQFGAGSQRHLKKTNDTVCGIATNDKYHGTIYQEKKDLHSKLPGCPDQFMTYVQATKKNIDLSWYVDQVEKVIF